MAKLIAAASVGCYGPSSAIATGSYWTRFGAKSWEYLSLEWSQSAFWCERSERERGNENGRRRCTIGTQWSGVAVDGSAEGEKKLCIVSQQKKQPGAVGGGERGSKLGSEKKAFDNWNKILVVAEGLCIVGVVASHGASYLYSKQVSSKPEASCSTNTLAAPLKFGGLSTWQILPVWGALVINAVLRAHRWQSSRTSLTSRVEWEELGLKDIKDFSLSQRVGKLEEDSQTLATIVRTLSRQLEKLGVRFRVTRRVLRDPIQETAVLTQKTSEAVSALSRREDMLENELRETQKALVAMQELQGRQLELLAAAIAKASQADKLLQQRVKREVLMQLNSPGKQQVGTFNIESQRKGRAALESRKQSLLKKLDDLGKGLTQKDNESSNRMGTEKSLLNNGQKVGNSSSISAKTMKIGKLSSSPDQRKENKSNARGKSNDTLSKDDFWADKKVRNGKPSTKPADDDSKEDYWAEPAPNSSIPELDELDSSSDRPTDAVPRFLDAQNISSPDRIGSFFTSRQDASSNRSSVRLSGNDLGSSTVGTSMGTDWKPARREETLVENSLIEMDTYSSSEMEASDISRWNSQNDAQEYTVDSHHSGDGHTIFDQSSFVDTDIIRGYYDGHVDPR